MKLNVERFNELVKPSTPTDLSKIKEASTSKVGASTLDEQLSSFNTSVLSNKDLERYKVGVQVLREEGHSKYGKLSRSKVIQIGNERLIELEKVKRRERIEYTLSNKPSNFHIVRNNEQLEYFCERLNKELNLQETTQKGKYDRLGVKTLTAIDFEGTGIDVFKDLSIGFSIWFPLLDEGYYISYGHIHSEYYEYTNTKQDVKNQVKRSDAIKVLESYLSDPTHGKSAHMGSTRYDMHITEQDGYTLKGLVIDTRDVQHLLYEHEESFALKLLVDKYKDYLGIEHEVFTFDDLFGNSSPAPYNIDLVGVYAIYDVYYGWKLTEFQWSLLNSPKRNNLLNWWCNIGIDLPNTDLMLQRTGICFDKKEVIELTNEFTERLEQARNDIITSYNINDEFIYQMDRKLNANKHKEWYSKNERAIERIQKRIDKNTNAVNEYEAKGRTHTKAYSNAVSKLAEDKEEIERLKSIKEPPQIITEFKTTNTNHLAYLIYDVLGIEDVTGRFKRGKSRSTSADVMAVYYDTEPSLKPLATVAELEKAVGTYLTPIIDDERPSYEVTGRIHSSFDANGTSTGRYSSSQHKGRPNNILREFTDKGITVVGKEIDDDVFFDIVYKLVHSDDYYQKGLNAQNLPSKNEGYRIRNLFKPKEGYTFVGSDLGQIEPRIQAHIMYTVYGDNSMREIFLQGIDLYNTMAMKVFKVPQECCLDGVWYDFKTETHGSDKASKPPTAVYLRKIMKQGILAKSYGQTVQAFARNLKIDEETAQLFFDEFDKEFPAFTQMVSDTINGMIDNGYSETIYGRKRRFTKYHEVLKDARKNQDELFSLYKRRKALRNSGVTKSNELTEIQKRIEVLGNSKGLVGYYERAAFNHKIQGSGADVLKMISNKLAHVCRLRNWEFNLTIHDEIKISIPNEEMTKENVELVSNIMKHSMELSVPLTTDTVIEPCWQDEYSIEQWDFDNNKPKGDN